MIETTNAKNVSWDVGATVKVGFMRLKVAGIRAVKDGLPDIYTLVNLSGDRAYDFIPHRGLTLIARRNSTGQLVRV